MTSNASYYAFTATPKPKTLEMFGIPYSGDEGKTKFRPFHPYTMKQAIQEGFIVDVLENYTPVQSWYRLETRVYRERFSITAQLRHIWIVCGVPIKQ